MSAYHEPLRIFFHGTRDDLIKEFPRPGTPLNVPDHFDEFVDIATYNEPKSFDLKQSWWVGARILFEVQAKSRMAMANVGRKLSTLPGLFDRLPSASFFVRTDYPIELPKTLRTRVRCFSGPRERTASLFRMDPKLFTVPIHPLLYSPLLKGTLVPGYRYSSALVSAMCSIEQIRLLEEGK